MPIPWNPEAQLLSVSRKNVPIFTGGLDVMNEENSYHVAASLQEYWCSFAL